MLTTFAGARLDRAAERRGDAAWLAARLADPASRAVAVTRSGVALDPDDETRLARFPLGVLPAGGARTGVARDAAPAGVAGGDTGFVLLGLEDGAALFAVDADGAVEGVGLRDAAARLRQEEGALAAHATALVNWHRAHPHCSRCGERTEVALAGYVRRCPRCEAEHHPRTDPVVIMVVGDGDRALLGRQPAWPPGRYSALAGYVEPGESLEEAVAREVLEEAGVRIRDPRYVGSQPWPFPASLMLGFVCGYAGGDASVRDGELDDVRWFTRAELRDALAGRGSLRLPPPEAIAHRLIRHWLEG